MRQLTRSLLNNAELLQAVQGSGGGGGKGGGGSGRTAQEDPNTLKTNSIVRVLDAISEGPIVGLVNGSKSIFLDATQLQDDAGNYNFKGVTWQFRYGTPDQDIMVGVPDAESVDVINAEILHTTPLTRTVDGPLDAARITFSIPALTNQDPNTGDLHGSSVTLQISKRVTGTSTWTATTPITITGKCVSTYQTSARVELGGTTDWDLKVERVTEDSALVNIQNHTWWATTTSIIDAPFIYPDTAYIGLAVDAQQFGSSIPKRAYDVKGLIVQIPSNYNPTTRAYTGLWDGTFTTAWTDNPAWVLYDILTNTRYGLGKFIDPTQVDKWALYTIAQYCDELVPNGYGGYEPRYTFNYQINSSEDAYKIVQSIASSFRGITCWSSGTVFFVADSPADPIKLVSPADVLGGMFTYEDQGFSASHSVCLVTWFDPKDQCNQTIEVVQDKELIRKLGWRVTSLTAYGCTSRGLAHRLGKWVLDNEKYGSETVAYDVAFDHLDVLPGMIVEIADPAYQGARMGGRVVEAGINYIDVDAAVAIESGQTYTLKYMLPNGAIDSRALNNTPGNYTRLTFSADLANRPIIGGMWILTASNLAPRQFRIMSITEVGNDHYTVHGVFHDPNKYARIEQNIVLEDSPYSVLQIIRPGAPLGISFHEYLYRYNSVVRSAVVLTWTPPNNTQGITAYEVQYRRANGNWSSVSPTAAQSVDILNIDSGAYTFRVRALGLGGIPGEWLEVDTTLFGLTAPPTDVTGFTAHVIKGTASLLWNSNTELDIDHYRIKYSTLLSGATWEASVDLAPHIFGTSTQVPALVGTYLIKAVDTSGVESVNAAAFVSNVSNVLGYTEVSAISDYPTWGGTKVHTEVSGTDLIMSLDGGGTVYPTGSYTLTGYTDLGDIFTSRVSAAIDAEAANITDLIGDWVTIEEQVNISGSDPGLWSIQMQLRYTSDDPAGTPTWSDWENLVLADYTARAFQFRFLIYSYDLRIQPIVYDVTATIHMEDRTENGRNVSVSTGGITVTYTTPFKSAPAVSITGRDLATGDYWEYTTLPTATGFAGKWKDASGTAVVRSMDWIADGFGFGPP